MRYDAKRLTHLDYLRMAFWEAHTDDETMRLDDLAQMSADLQALAEDAATYWMTHGCAPMLCDPEEGM